MDGKVAIVTGAAQGLGKAFSEALLARGSKVIVSDINEEKCAKTTEEFVTKYGEESARFQKCDVASNEDMEALFSLAKSTYGRLDVVVNNAGISHEGRWEAMVDINLKGVIRGTMLGIEHMSRDKGGAGGVIINMASASGVRPTPFVPVYAATKHGVLAYSRGLTRHPALAKTGVRINCLCPFSVDTDIIKYDQDMVFGDLDLVQKNAAETGVLPVSTVVESFVELLLDENRQGQAVLISTNGVKLVPLQYNNFLDMTAGSV